MSIPKEQCERYQPVDTLGVGAMGTLHFARDRVLDRRVAIKSVRLETSLELPAGQTEFRIYISAEGQATQSLQVDSELSGGENHVLRLVIGENGSASAQLK